MHPVAGEPENVRRVIPNRPFPLLLTYPSWSDFLGKTVVQKHGLVSWHGRGYTALYDHRRQPATAAPGKSRFENGMAVPARRTSCEEEEGSDLRPKMRRRDRNGLENEADLFDTIAEVVVSPRRSSTTAFRLALKEEGQ